MEGCWWQVKVYDPESESYTHLSKFADSAEEAEDDVDPEDWVVCRGKTIKEQEC